MPLLGNAKHRIGRRLGSGATASEGTKTCSAPTSPPACSSASCLTQPSASGGRIPPLRSASPPSPSKKATKPGKAKAAAPRRRSTTNTSPAATPTTAAEYRHAPPEAGPSGLGPAVRRSFPTERPKSEPRRPLPAVSAGLRTRAGRSALGASGAGSSTGRERRTTGLHQEGRGPRGEQVIASTTEQQRGSPSEGCCTLSPASSFGPVDLDGPLPTRACQGRSNSFKVNSVGAEGNLAPAAYYAHY